MPKKKVFKPAPKHLPRLEPVTTFVNIRHTQYPDGSVEIQYPTRDRMAAMLTEIYVDAFVDAVGLEPRE